MRKRCIRSCMILLLVLFSFSGVYAQYAPPVSSFHAALVLEDERLTRDKNYFLIWKMYARALSHPEYKLDENVAEVLPGQYENARTAILKRMRELAGQEEVSSRVTPEAEAFLKEVQQGTIGNEAALERGRPYLPLAEGFPIFDLLGDRYLESGGCEKAVSVWEEAKEISLGYGAFTPKKKISYLTKLGHCYKELGWKDKLESLFSEFPNLTQEEGQEVLENWDSVQKALEGLHRYVQDCPPQVPSSLASVPAESEESFFIRKESFLEPDGEFYDQEQLCFDENPKWCFETTKLFFVSKPFIYRGRVYSVVKEKGGALYLQVLDRKTGQLLTQRYLGYHPKIVSRRGSLYPYSLNLKEGKIHLDTEVFHGEFTIDGTISSLIHLTEPQLPQALKEQYRFSRDIENGGPKLLVFLLAQDAESLRVLKGADLEKYQNIFKKLREEAPSLLPYLIEAYREAGKGDSLIEWMAQMGSTAVIPLVTAVQNNPLERGMAVKVLEKMKEDPMPQLLSLLNSDNPKLRKKVARILGEWALEDLRGISALIERYETEENSVVQLALVGTLANSKHKDVIQKKELVHLKHQEDLLDLEVGDLDLLNLLPSKERLLSYIWLSEHHKDPQVRKEALILTLRDEDVVTKKLSEFSLDKRLSQEQNPEVRAAIIAELPLKYQNKVLEHLKAHSQEAPVIIASLDFLSGAQETQDFISLAESYLDHENPEVARAALHGIMRHDGPAGLGDERAIHLVRHNPHPYVRQVAAGLVPNTPEGNAILREVFTAAQDVEVKAEMASELLGRGAGDEALVSFLFREFEHHGELGRNIKLGLTPQTLPMYQKVFSELDLFPLTQGLIRQEIRAFELKHRSD